MEDKAKRKVRVALVAPSTRVLGGQSVQADRLVRAFAGDLAVELTLVENDPLAVFHGVKYLRTIFTSLKYWMHLIRTARAADLFVVSSAAMTGYVIATLPALFAAKIFGRKAVLNYHSGNLDEHIRHWPRVAVPTMRMFDDIVVPSQFLAEIFGRHGLAAKVINNFVDTARFPYRKREALRPVFLSNRNFEAHYNVGDILRAFAVIRREVPGAELIVAGFGSEEAALRKLAADLGLSGVEFAGRLDQDRMAEMYGKADVYLNTSVVDNMPLSFIEAFSCGVPVVSYATGGIPHIVEDGRTGLLVETGDHGDLARKALMLLRDPELAQSLTANAFEECQKYSTAKVIDDWRGYFAASS